MRKIAANFIFPVSKAPIKNGIIIVEDDGTIIDLIDNGGKLPEIAGLEFYNGIITPGFINAHCHIELSYLKNKFSNLNGLPDFIKKILSQRSAIPENLMDIINAANIEMYHEGIVAVGDIINHDFSFQVKAQSKILYKSFAEVFDISPARTYEAYKSGLDLIDKAHLENLYCSLVPHAPYSVTPALFEKILQYQQSSPGIFSIHNQETVSENALFLEKSGPLLELMSGAGADFSVWGRSESSLKAISEYFPANSNLLLVHNIYTGVADIEFLKNKNLKVHFVLCPASNLIIEQKLPDVEMLLNSGFPVAIGTDSYSSNTSLSVIKELKIISENFPNISLNDLVNCATLNGAKALELENVFGSFDKGKKPGVNLIQNVDFEKMKLTPDSFVKKLV